MAEIFQDMVPIFKEFISLLKDSELNQALLYIVGSTMIETKIY